MDNVFKDLNQCCRVYINDIHVFFEAIGQHKNGVLAITQRCIGHSTILGKNLCIYTEKEMKFLGIEIKVGQIILQRYILKKKKRKFF